jgi:putative PIN family toxin of toxin-antitoxin system
MKTVVVDTNVLVSAILRDRTPELVIQYIVENPDVEWVASSEILAEYKAVLARPKFRLPQDLQDAWATLLEAEIAIVDVDTTASFPRDPKDAIFLSCAIATDADFIITGDTDLLSAELSIKTNIVTVATFKALFRDISTEK